jgi:hypothetical protein
MCVYVHTPLVAPGPDVPSGVSSRIWICRMIFDCAQYRVHVTSGMTKSVHVICSHYVVLKHCRAHCGMCRCQVLVVSASHSPKTRQCASEFVADVAVHVEVSSYMSVCHPGGRSGVDTATQGTSRGSWWHTSCGKAFVRTPPSHSNPASEMRGANEVNCCCQCHVKHGIAHSSATNNIATDPATCTLRGAYPSLSTNDISPNNATLICRCIYSIHLEDNRDM